MAFANARFGRRSVKRAKVMPRLPAKLHLADRAALAGCLYAGKICVEIGVHRGEHAAVMLAAGPAKLYLVDPWAWQAYRAYPEQHSRSWKKWLHAKNDAQMAERYNQIYQETKSTVGKDPRVEIIRECSLDAVKRFAPEALDVAYVDANHSYEACAADARAWWAKLRSGGYLCVHDYGSTTCREVTRAADAFLRELGREQYDILTDEPKGTCVLRKA